MANIICVETATTNCSVALSVSGKCVFLKEDNALKYSHAERLHDYVAAVFAFAKAKEIAIDAISVSKGPGSYTGLRIGVSAVKGWCFAYELPLISVPTLAIVAQQVATDGGFIIPMLDARRMEVYSAVYTSEHEVLCVTEAKVLDATSYQEYLDKDKVFFVGDGVVKFKEICAHPNAIFAAGNTLPSAQEQCTLAESKFNQGDFENVAYFEPYYLKDFIAGKPKKLI